MTKDTAAENAVPTLGSDGFDPLEAGVRQQLHSLIEGLLEKELTAALNRAGYGRSSERPSGGH